MDRVKKSVARINLEYWAFRLVVGSLEIAPRAVASRLGVWYARVLDRVIPRLRRVAMRNLEIAYPSLAAAEKRRLANEVFVSLGRMLAAFARFPSLRKESIQEWIRYEGFEHFEEARRRGKGVLFATGHLGNWELSAFAHAFLGRPMHVVVRPLDNPKLDAFVEKRRSLSGNTIVAKRDFARPILRALRDNEAVGILVDQNSGLDGGVFVDFFGVPACVSTAFAKLAAHSGAAVIPGFAVWSEKEARYILRFYPIVEMTGDAAADTRAVQRRLQEAIAECPGQWLWIHRRWKTRPAGEPPLYAGR